MALWSNTDANTSAPKYVTSYLKVSQSSANVNLAYGNTTTSAFITNANVGIFAVDTNEMANTSASNKASHPAHAGWILRTAGTGGRAGRVTTEVLVAMGSMTGDGSASANDDVIFQDTAA
jgi:hypothetical protein